MKHYPLGPASWPLWLRMLLPYSNRFANAALAHDWLYELGGDGFERRMADLAFFELMLDECDTVFQTFFAFLYFVLVRTFGSAFFNYAEGNA